MTHYSKIQPNSNNSGFKPLICNKNLLPIISITAQLRTLPNFKHSSPTNILITNIKSDQHPKQYTAAKTAKDTPRRPRRYFANPPVRNPCELRIRPGVRPWRNWPLEESDPRLVSDVLLSDLTAFFSMSDGVRAGVDFGRGWASGIIVAIAKVGRKLVLRVGLVSNVSYALDF